MKILMVGASGTLGTAVRKELGQHHEIITAGRKGADITMDMSVPESIASMYKAVGSVDAVVCTAGQAYFGPLHELTPELNEIAIMGKLKGANQSCFARAGPCS